MNGTQYKHSPVTNSKVIVDKPFYYSKKFWVAVVAMLIPVANKSLALGFASGELLTIIAPLITYIVGQGIADNGRNK